MPAGWSKARSTTPPGPGPLYSEVAVGVKEGYYDITWDPSARLVWGADLAVDNVLLMRSPTLR